LLAASLMASVTGCDEEPGKRDEAIIFLARGEPRQDANFQRFQTAFNSRHEPLLTRVRLTALALPDDEAGIEHTLRQAALARPRMFVAQNGTQARLVRRAAPQVTLIFSSRADPLKLGVVSDLVTRPEPATGLWINDRLHAKRLELLLDAYPSLRSVAVLGDPEWKENLGDLGPQMMRIATDRGVKLHLLSASSATAALELVSTPSYATVDGWCLPRSTLTLDGRLIARLAAVGKPVIAGFTPDVKAGAHLSYAHDSDFVTPALADLVARVVMGEAPQQIPIQTPQRFQLAVRASQDKRLPAINPALVRRADLVVR
jgi:putative tryptophan/tyrosine transport system substrate-binding protein